MGSLRSDVRQSRVLSLSYRPEDNVRIPAISSSSTKSSELVGSMRRSRPMDGGSTDRSIDLSSRSRSHRSKTPVQDQSPLIPPVDSTDQSNDRQAAVTGDDTRVGHIIRPLERAAAADSCYWHAAGMTLDGRSKSFVLPDRCPARRSHPVGIERSVASPLPATIATIAPSSTGNISIQQQQQQQHRSHYGYHHHSHHHEHHHQSHRHPHQDQEPQQRPPLSSSSTSSSFSSTDHIMLPPSPTTPSVITAQSAASRVRTAATSSTSRVHDDVVLYLSALSVSIWLSRHISLFSLCLFVVPLSIFVFFICLFYTLTCRLSSPLVFEKKIFKFSLSRYFPKTLENILMHYLI